MKDTIRHELFRYLHERHDMTQAERFAAEWGLLTSAEHRREYAAMTQMHRSLVAYFAQNTRTPGGGIGWLRVGAVSVLIATAGVVAGVLSMHPQSEPVALAQTVRVVKPTPCASCVRTGVSCVHRATISHLPGRICPPR